MAVVHSNKHTAMQVLASLAVDHEEEEVYLYTDVIRGVRKQIGDDMHVSLCCKATPAYQEA